MTARLLTFAPMVDTELARLVLSDLAVAAALVPLPMPPHLTAPALAPAPTLVDMPPVMLSGIDDAQARPTMRLAERVYAVVKIEPVDAPQYSN